MSRKLDIQAERKRRFLELYKKHIVPLNLTYDELHDKLQCPASTIKDTCNSYDVNNYKTNPSIKCIKFNAEVVIAFCRHFDFDINYIYYGVETEPAKINNAQYSLFKHSVDCMELEDEAFMGTYYGYTYNTMHNELDNFTLKIIKTPNGSCNAILELECFKRITDKKTDRIRKTLYGKPMHLKPNLIYIVFQANEGDEIYIMAYRYFKINYGKRLYCRYGSIIVNKRETIRYPQMQSFVFFDEPIKQENLHYINGFLKLSNDKIIVPASIVDNKNDEDDEQTKNMKKFFEACNDIKFNKEEYYCFSEKVLLSLGEFKEIPNDIISAALITLKEKSINPVNISYPDNNLYAKFLSSLCSEEEKMFNNEE